MILPELIKTNRKREYNNYSDSEKSKVLYSYLFESLSHRDIDKKVLNLDSSVSRGYQSMGILHFLGMRNNYKGIFKNSSIDYAIEIMDNYNDDRFSEIIRLLSFFKDNPNDDH